ncbi:hypothetical protein EV421DRAFT_528459 [Armillaria borealis]|uniref:Uncharacterized protein n=1 Tax=Armillaria borealis TaxID=47425 RepID=A0AA39JLP2_9AGAR|nr:hypothetical protein EV421DRAFT_528459 [Armillaria borealis]
MRVGRAKVHGQLVILDEPVSEGADGQSDIRTVTIRAESGESMLDVMQTFKLPHHEVLASVAVGKHAVLCGHTNTEGGSRLPPSVDEPEIILVFQQNGPTKMMF